MADLTFSVKSEWNGGFSVTSTSKDFLIGGQNIERNTEYRTNIGRNMIFQFNSQEKEKAQLYVSCMDSLAACLTQTILAHATSMGIQIDSININVEGDVDLHGFTGISNDVRPLNWYHH